MKASITQHALSCGGSIDSVLQEWLNELDAQLRNRYGMKREQTAIGLLDLLTARVAMVRPDDCQYAASVSKIGILLAYFAIHPNAANNLDPPTRHQLGLMIKASSNEMASKFSHQLGLKKIQEVLNACGFYDAKEGAGIWVGKHYGEEGERYGDPLHDHTHAATVRQVLRYFFLLESGQLLSPAASQVMREIFQSPNIPHDPIKFVRGLEGRNVEIIRKWGSWEHWLHDAAVIKGEGRNYILVALTHHSSGDDYLVDLARKVDDLLLSKAHRQ